jgi:hypothetical protein
MHITRSLDQFLVDNQGSMNEILNFKIFNDLTKQLVVVVVLLVVVLSSIPMSSFYPFLYFKIFYRIPFSIGTFTMNLIASFENL